MSDRTTQIIDGLRKMSERESFDALDHQVISNMPDKELAAWHADQSVDSAQYLLATHEWNRRLITRQVNATKFSAYIGLAGVIMGVVLGWCLGSIRAKEAPEQIVKQVTQPQMQDKAKQQPDQKLQGMNPDSVPPKPASQPPPK